LGAYEQKREFLFLDAPTEAIGSVLYEDHIRRVPSSRLAPFAGYLMPLWFSSIADEHRAVRENAGLFDCTHMGALALSGPEAQGFLNTIATNDVSQLEPGRAQYSYILNIQGQVLDDIIVYQRQQDDYLLVVNAANKAKIKAYLTGLLQDELIIDLDSPERSIGFGPELGDLHSDTENGLVDIALQGPRSLEILCTSLTDSARDVIMNLRPFRLIQSRINDIPCIVSRTGYTGAALGVELLVHPAQASTLWNLLLQQGESAGLLPCGLGARDSLRIEAGLPLYGHELAGEFDISPFAAGYGWAVKLTKDFFIGKAAMTKLAETYTETVVRLEIPGGRGVRPVRQHDPVLSPDGSCRGWILSSASAGNRQVALAYVEKAWADTATEVGLYYLARSGAQVKQGRKQKANKQEFLTPDLSGVISTRFAKF
jgi:glycine cleavage system T protein